MNSLDDKLAELRARFVSRAGDEIAAIDQALREGDRGTLIERGHALAGIAGMFGFADVGEAAAKLEQAAGAEGPVEGPAERLRMLLAGLAKR